MLNVSESTMPLWAQLRIRNGYADAEEIARLETLTAEVVRVYADCSPCNTSCELTPGVCQSTCEKTSQTSCPLCNSAQQA